MQYVGIRELKAKLTYYIGLTKKGDSVIVTERGAPVAVLHSLDVIAPKAGLEEKLASLAKRGMINLPTKRGKLPPFKSIKAKGKPLSKIIIEDRK